MSFTIRSTTAGVWSVFNSIKNQKKIIRYKVGKELNSKYVPDIKFFLDDEYERYDTINKIIHNG